MRILPASPLANPKIDKSKRCRNNPTMPTVLRQDGFRVMIPTHDHPPAHVHCYRGDALVVVILPTETSDALIREIGRVTKPRDMSDAMRIVNENRTLLWNEWNKLYGQS